MPHGKYFKIRSQLSDLVLDIFDGKAAEGASIVTWPEKDEDIDNQVWFADPLTKTIRTKVDPEYCMEIDGEGFLVLNPYSKRDSQMWKVAGDRIQKFVDTSRVLDIYQSKTDKDARICEHEFLGNDNQLWTFEHLPAKYFFIKSRMHGHCLDVWKSRKKEGTKVVMWPKKGKPQDNQLWYEDQYGYIRSKLSNMVIDGSDREVGLKTRELNNESTRQRWTRAGGEIVNVDRPEEVFDVYKCNCDDGAKCVAYKKNGGNNQKWEFEPCEC